MTLVRNLRVIESGPREEERFIRAAFASSDGVHVDQHLAAAERFVIYSVGKTTAVPTSIGEFATKTHPETTSRLKEKLSWLADCDVVYSVAVGSSASMQLMARGVLPLRTTCGSSIESLLVTLQEELDNSVAGWLKQVTRFKAQQADAPWSSDPELNEEPK